MAIDIPSWIPREAWDGWVSMRKMKKKPLTDGATQRAINTLQRLMEAGQDPKLVLNQSEDRGWTGLFPLSDSYLQEQGLVKPQAALLQRLTDTSWV